LGDLLQKFRRYKEVSKVSRIARRYLVMNGFDGILVFLGLLVGMYLSEIKEPTLIIFTSLSTFLAVAISGFVGTFVAEKAEREKEIRSLERAMLRKLSNTIIRDAARFACFYSALVAAISPMLFAFIPMIPIFLTTLGLLNFDTAFFISISLALIILFLLGIFLGKISEENKLLWGIKLLILGCLTLLILFLVKNFP